MGSLAEPYTFACDDPLEFATLFDDWEHEVVQISGGRFGFREVGVRLPGMSVGLVNFSQHFELTETTASPVIGFLFLMSADEPFRVAGSELTEPHLVIQLPSEENAFVCGGPTSAFYVQVDFDFARDMGWKIGPHRHFALFGQDWKTFTKSCSRVLRLSQKRLSPARQLACRDEALQSLGQLLSSHGVLAEISGSDDPVGDRSVLQTFLRVKTEMRDRRLDAPLNVAEIAESLGISERHMHRQFKRWAGIGPARYFEIMRLHALRARLRIGDGKFGRVSAAAQKFGFSNPGRMAARYGELFSELPGETVRRARRGVPRTLLPIQLTLPME